MTPRPRWSIPAARQIEEPAMSRAVTAASAAPPAAGSVLDLIGSTPLVEARGLDAGPCRLFLKLESQNPGGSIKDRIALSMIAAAEADGRLKPGSTIVEATAGNTGLGLALVGRAKGYRVLLVVPDKMAREKIVHCRAMGAEVIVTRTDVNKGHPDYYQDMAERLAAEIPGAFYVNQFANPANPLAHERTTGPEILAQMEGDVDAVVCGVGSGGTLSGLGRFFARHSPKTKMVLADPAGSILAPLVERGETIEPGSWAVEGIGEDFVPPNCDLSFVAKAYTITDAESFAAARDLLVKEGILGGSSSGTLLAAALRHCRAQTEPKRVVAFVCDTGAKYLSKVFNTAWLMEEGLIERAKSGAVRDLVMRSAESGEVISVAPGDSLRTAISRMRSADVSQVPVMERGSIVGILHESDVLGAFIDPARGEGLATPVGDVMVRDLRTLEADRPLEALLPLFADNLVGVILDRGRFLGLVTRIDLINHLKRAL
jgi:cystathionine beta-synthase